MHTGASLAEYACIIEIVKHHSDKEQPESLHTGDADASSTAADSALQYNHESECNTCYPFNVMHPLFETHTNGAHQIVHSIDVWGKTFKPPTTFSENK